jgi:hypothetical protein
LSRIPFLWEYGNKSKWEKVNNHLAPFYNGGMAQDTMKVVIDEDLKRRFKAACATQDITMSDVVSALVQGWLNGQIPLPEQKES